MTRINFEEVSVKATKKWIDKNGKRRQKTKRFYQTVNPFNTNPDGMVKTRDQIQREIIERRDKWLKEEVVE